jgi:AcrR family transcriptional regulator
MDAARSAFAEHGTDLPMEDLARRAGVGIGTVYRHFPNKEALLEALLIDQFAWRLETTRKALAKDDAWRAFRELVEAGSERNARDVGSCEMLMDQAEKKPSPEVAAMQAELRAEITKLLDRAKESGSMRADFTADDVPLLFASITGAISAFGPDGPWRRQRDFLLDGLRA